MTVIPQTVPSDYCLRCRGCCLFRGAADDWRPRLGIEEEIAAERRVPGCSAGGALRALPFGDRAACVFLDVSDHRCRVYADRPLECALYPFLLSPTENEVVVYAHLACPYIRAAGESGGWTALAARVTAFLSSERGRALLMQARAVCPDYSRYGAEVERVAALPVPDPGLALLASRAALEQALASRRAVLSGRAFPSLYAWTDHFVFSVEDIAGAVGVFARRDGITFLMFPPLAPEITPEAVTEAFSRMGPGGAARIEGVAEAELPAFAGKGFGVRRQGEEYVYARSALAALSGNRFRSRRSDVHRFLRGPAAVFRPFAPEDAPACAALFERWLDKRRRAYEDDIHRAMLVENRVVHRRLLAAAGLLGLTARVVERAGELVGYTLGYPLNAETFCVALEITEPGVMGLPAFIFRELCADPAVAPFPFVNVMDDFGMPAVAAVKRSWRPVRMEPVYAICLER